MRGPRGASRPPHSRALAGAAFAVLIVAGVVWASWELHASRTFQLFGEFVPSARTSDSVVALTFDDGPVEAYTDSVLDVLDAHQVPATFFVVGESVQRHPELAQRIVSRGHALGNHSFSHQRMILHGQAFYRDEVERTDSLIRTAGQTGPIPFRPPYGNRLLGLPWYLRQTGRTTVLWSIEPDTWYSRADSMTAHVLDRVRPGAIILLHVEIPSRREGRAALPAIIEGVRAKGYRFVTVPDLLALDRIARDRAVREAGARD